MTHDQVVQLVGTYGQLYMLGLFILLVAIAIWPRKGRSFEREARIPLADDKVSNDPPPRCRDKGKYP